MTSPFRHGTAALRAAGLEAGVLVGHLLLYASGLTQEQFPGLSASAAAPALVTPPSPGPVGAPDPSEPPSPVLLVHGLIDNRSVFAVLRRSLRRHGWTHVHALNHCSLAPDLRTAAADLALQVEAARRCYGGQRVALVGHSLGGLIARYYVQRLGGDEHVHTVITLGTPHSGTQSARLSLLPAVRQMRPGSPVLEELGGPAPGCRTRFVAIWSDMDEVIVPRESGALVHPDLEVRNVRMHGVGHLALPVHGGTLAQIRAALSTWDAPDRAPAAGTDAGPGTGTDAAADPRLTA